MARVLVDTSAIYALIDRNDTCHQAAKSRLKSLREARAEPILTNFIVAESHSLLLARLGASTARRWLLTNLWSVERVTAEDEDTAKDIIKSFVDKTFSYTDATSFAAMERLFIKEVFAFDRHFQQYGFQLLS